MDRVVWLYNDTVVTVSVSWLQPLQVNANGNLTKYRVRLTPTGGSSLDSISKIVDPIEVRKNFSFCVCKFDNASKW